MLTNVLSRILDTAGNIVLTSRAGDLGMAYRHGPRTRQRVALTFDDGPVRGGTEAVLDAMDDFGIRGTFFFVGANIQMHPDIVRRAYEAGHAIGMHSMNHSRLDTISLHAPAHISDCARVFEETLGCRPALYRPPWGWLTPWEALRLRSRGLAIIRWDIETRDWLVPCPPGDEMYAWILPRVRPGSIIVFHDGMTHADYHAKPETVRAVRLLAAELRTRDYECVTVADLLGIPAYHHTGAAGSANAPLPMSALPHVKSHIP